MKRMLGVLMLMAAAMLAEDAPLQAITGEVVDVHCYVSRAAHGPEHAGCSNACISRDVPAALLTEDGTLYLLLGEKPVSIKDKLAGLAGKTVTAHGRVVERNGMKAIQVTRIE